MNQTPDTQPENYPLVYGYSKGMKITLSILAPVFTAGFLWVTISAFTDPGNDRQLWVKLMVAGLCFIVDVIMVIGLLESYLAKLYVYSDRLRFKEVIGEKEIALADIEGFRIRPNRDGFYLIPKDASRKKLPIPSNLERMDELGTWMESKFKNLDVLDFQAEEEKILTNEELGATPDERQEKLARARRFIRHAKWPSLVIMFWAMTYPWPYELAMACAAIVPMIGVVLVIKNPGLFRVDEKYGGAYPSVINFLLPGFALVARAILDYNFDHIIDMWFPSAAVLLILGALLFWKSPEYHAKPQQFLSILFILAIYSCGLVLQGNCLLDTSGEIVHTVHVSAKRADKGRHTSYYLTVSAWGTRLDKHEVAVRRSTYDVVQVGDSVHVKERTGLLQVHWYYVRPRSPRNS